jgi:pSer/pThr/pTyr-binding forkhead associated (FHA) protein
MTRSRYRAGCVISSEASRMASSGRSRESYAPAVLAYLEVHRPAGVELVPLEADRVTVGRTSSNDITLASDGKVSRLHAVLERLSETWCIRDLGSRNGTFLNGERVDRDRVVRPGDEIRVGGTRLVYRAEKSSEVLVTEIPERVPSLTQRERDVLLALFQPAVEGEVFAEPASTREIATTLSVSEAAIKQHLAHLYDKFGIHEGDRRRVKLANEALRRGAVSLADARSARS